MIQSFLLLNNIPQADALAIAICHFHTKNSLRSIPSARKIVKGRLR